MQERKSIILLSLCLFMLGSGLFAQNANRIIEKVDQLMYPNCKSEIRLIFQRKDGTEEVYTMKTYAKDLNQKVIVRFTSPPYQVGNDLIMLERNVWSYNKKAGRIMKIPSNQAFGDTGFAYGDVVRLNMTDNYTAEILSQTDDSWLLNLQSKERNAPYYRIEFQVKKGSYMPVKATCIARNDKIIKTMEFTEVKAVNGKGKPTRIVVKSPYDPGEVSIMIMENEELKEYPDRIFNKRNLAMGQEERY